MVKSPLTAIVSGIVSVTFSNVLLKSVSLAVRLSRAETIFSRADRVVSLVSFRICSRASLFAWIIF